LNPLLFHKNDYQNNEDIKMFKRLISISLSIALFILCLAACDKTSLNKNSGETAEKKKFTQTYIDYFDTVSTIVGFDVDEGEFKKKCDFIKQQLSEYNSIYDIYKSYDGINNLYTVNKNAGIGPVKVDTRIIDLLDFCKKIYDLTGGQVNVAMGSVLSIWHDYRTEGINNPKNASLPSVESLNMAAKHTDFSKIIIDRENSTVYLDDKDMTLDVGAIAKGYATEQIAKALIEQGVTNYTLNIGGNIRTIGSKADGTPWTAAITNPDTKSENASVMTVKLSGQSFVTSGSYQRYYEVDGKRYHHIIDAKTLFPRNEFSSVSILSKDSGLADALSTALFNMSYEDGKKLISSIEGVEALWITDEYEIFYTDGFADIILK